ncbi:MAG TPA: CheB methylesterase domain-containing protein [Casimicrobiaceae bacterium]|jgi:two-component system chemotaxis response regulator CheB
MMPPAVVCIGASTGGTDAIRSVLAGLPQTCPPVLVVQHMPASFTPGFAARLDAACALGVKEAEDGEPLARGCAYIARGDRHLALAHGAAGWVARVSDAAPLNRHRPSIDVLFASVVRAAGRQAIGVILTGMGTDGAAGLRALRAAGAYTIAQDEHTSAVFGMPREAIAMGAAMRVLPLGRIADAIVERLAMRAPERDDATA